MGHPVAILHELHLLFSCSSALWGQCNRNRKWHSHNLTCYFQQAMSARRARTSTRGRWTTLRGRERLGRAPTRSRPTSEPGGRHLAKKESPVRYPLLISSTPWFKFILQLRTLTRLGRSAKYLGKVTQGTMVVTSWIEFATFHHVALPNHTKQH